MMEVIGKATHRGTCMNCEGEIELIVWGGEPGIWEHVEGSERPGGGMQGVYCKGSPRAEPQPDTTERLN